MLTKARRREGQPKPFGVPILNVPFPVLLDLDGVGYDVEVLCVGFSYEVGEDGSDEGLHPTERSESTVSVECIA